MATQGASPQLQSLELRRPSGSGEFESGGSRPPSPPTHLPWCSALGPTSSLAAGSWSREPAEVAGSGRLGCPGGRRPTCANAGKEERESRRRAPLTDLATGLRGPRVQALRALRGAPPRSGIRRLWRELECVRGGRRTRKWGGGKTSPPSHHEGTAARPAPWGRAKARVRRPGATYPPAARPLLGP